MPEEERGHTDVESSVASDYDNRRPLLGRYHEYRGLRMPELSSVRGRNFYDEPIREYEALTNRVIPSWATSEKNKAEARALELLERTLTPEQVMQKESMQLVLERGNLGIYEIPFIRGTVHFQTTEEVSEELIAIVGEKVPNVSARRRKLPWLKPKTPKSFFCEMCFLDTTTNTGAPWHDVVVTLLLHIRTGNEELLWQKAGIILTSVLMDGTCLR